MVDDQALRLSYKPARRGFPVVKNRCSLLVAAALAVSLAGCGGSGPDAPAATGSTAQSLPAGVQVTVQVEPRERPAESARKNIAFARGQRPLAAQVRLPELVIPKIQASLPGTPVQIGFAREPAATATPAAMRSLLQWQQGAQGSAAAVTFLSEGARGLRLGLLVRRLPAEAVVRGYVQDGPTLFEATGRTILATLQANRDAGDQSDEGATWWSPTTDSPALTLEIELPPGVAPDAIEVAVPRLSHMRVQSGELDTEQAIGDAGSCNVDVSCVASSQAGIDSASKAVAKMSYVSRGSSFVCTGTLLNNASGDFTDYLLSANHCISTQTVASTLVTYWRYRSNSCNSQSANYATLPGGATLLYAASATDTSFMRLNSVTPNNVTYAGWSTNAITSTVVGLHNPKGDLQKYSAGSFDGYLSCTSSTGGSFSCSSSTASTGKFLETSWTTGTTEGGSSGSGLFATYGSSGKRYLVGQLRGGNHSCSNTGGSSTYGRFDTAYYAGLANWLGAGLYRFYNSSTGAHFFTASVDEKTTIQASMPSFKYEGIGFYAFTANTKSGLSPVYRFYNTATGRHFYTISAAERDNVMATLPSYNYEGISWYARATSGNNALPLYRFFNPTTGTHFYTISQAEKDGLVANPASGFSYEGIAYYAWQ